MSALAFGASVLALGERDKSTSAGYDAYAVRQRRVLEEAGAKDSLRQVKLEREGSGVDVGHE